MKKITINGDNYIGHWNQCRTACRGLVIQDGKLLLSFLQAMDVYMIPGGGMDEGETDVECCIREIAEETGLLVEPQECIAEITEYYTDWKWVNRYYICKVVGEAEVHLTEQEKEQNMVTEWVTIEDALKLFGAYEDFRESYVMKRNIYFRENAALTSKEWDIAGK